MTSEVYAGVREILAGPDWEPVTVTDHGAFYTISGYFRSMAHTGSRKDWESLARDLDRIAREQFDALVGKPEPSAEVVAAYVSDTSLEPFTGLTTPSNAVIALTKPEPQPDPRDAELEAMRAKIEALEAAKRELEERELELKDANASLKDALSDIEDRIADLDEDDDFPGPDEKLSDWDVVGDVPALSPEEADTEVDRLIRNQSEGFDVADEISGLSQMRRDELTHAIHRKKGRMRRERMTGAAPQVAEEAALDHLVDLLARRGV